MIQFILGIFNRIKHRKERKLKQKETVERLTKEYQDLIQEYYLIKEKKSKLSKSQRDFVVLRINHLISKGHIKPT